MNEPQHTILLVEEDRALQRTLAEALHQSGFTVLAEHDGDWARRTFEQRRADMLVVDAMLPGRDGFQLALDIRRSDKGRRLPILLVCGTHQGARVKAQLDEIGGPVRSVEKPVEPSRVVALCRKALGLQDSEVAVDSDSRIRFRGSALVRGDLREADFAEVLSELHRRRATGALLLEHPPVKKLVWLKEGAPVFVRSNLLAEALGQVLVRERMITLAECEEGLRRVHASKRQLGTELIEMGCISPANLAYALQLQIEQKLFEVFAWTEGEYRFNPRASMPSMQIALELTPGRILLEGIKRGWDDQRTRRALGNVEAHAVALTGDPLDRFQDMGLDPEGAQLYALIDGKRTVRELLDCGVLPEEDARKLIHALRCANMIHFPVVEANAVQAASAPAAVPPPPHHPPPGQLSLAHDTLVDRGKRAWYELGLHAGPQRSGGEEVDRIIQAGERFRDGEASLAAGDPARALEAFAEAALLYPGEAEFQACLGWATWLSLAPGEAAAAQARPLLDKALELNPHIDRAYVFRGRIARALGRAQEAEAEFERALLCNPACAEALEELRLGGLRRT